MKIRPLDLSFLSHQYAPMQNDIRRTAQMILANAGWSKPSQQTLKEVTKAQKEWASKHKPSALSGFFDLLSIPLYGLANALDEGIAGHQSDPNDSVLSDIGQTVGGLFTGAGRGMYAGLRGGTAFTEELIPGMSGVIPDEWQTNPEDKTRFSDVAIRLHTGMSTADAMKPENWAEVKSKLDKINDKPFWNSSLSEVLIPDNLNDSKAKQDYFRNIQLGGIGADIVGDPLNFVSFGSKSLFNMGRGAKELTEGLDAARNANSAETILAGLRTPPMPKGGKGAKFGGVAPILDEAGDEIAVPDFVPAEPIGSIEDVGEFLNRVNNVKVPISELAPHADKAGKFKVAGRAIGKKDQKRLIKRIDNQVLRGEKGWQYRVGDIIREVPIEMPRTERFMQIVQGMRKKPGYQHNSKGFTNALAKAMNDDIDAARSILPATAVANKLDNVVYTEFQKLGKPMKKQYAKIANNVIRRYAGQVFGKKIPAQIDSPGAYLNAIQSGKTMVYSGPKQANMYDAILKQLPRRHPKRFERAVDILRAVEDFFISKGAVPYSSANVSESVPLRLSQVAEVIGPDILGKSHAFVTGILRGDPKALAQLSREEAQALEILKASEALVTAPAVNKGIEAGKNYLEEAIKIGPQSAARLKQDMKNAAKAAKLTAAEFGAGAVGAKTAAEYIQHAAGRTHPIERVMQANHLKTESWLAKNAITGNNVNDYDFTQSVTRAIMQATPLPSPRELGKIAGAGAHVKDWLGARFNAHYGVQDMRPIFLEKQASALSIANRRRKIIDATFGARGFNFPKNPQLAHEAMRLAQMNGIADGQVQKAADEISAIMENLFGGTGLRAGAIADSTVVGRSRLYMAELNEHLRRFGLGAYQFTNAKDVEDAAGVVHDFSQGADWLKSWEMWNIKNPYEFLHGVQNAVQQAVHQKGMFDEVIMRFGSPNKKGPVRYSVNHPRLKGIYFTEPGARQAQIFVDMIKDVNSVNPAWLRKFDAYLSKFKAAVTIYWPGHHMTNLIGDLYYNWIAGVNNPYRYEQAIRVMMTQSGRYGDIGGFKKLTSPESVSQAVARGQIGTDELGALGLKVDAPKGNSTLFKMKNGTKVTPDMIYTAMMQKGVLPSAHVMEETATDAKTIFDKFRPLGGRGQRAAHVVSEQRDHFTRIAQFIDVVAKSKKGFKAAADDAAMDVRKWHPDGLDLTKFERLGMKRLLPFYSWTRKAIPLAIEASLLAAPKVMAYPRLMEALALANGVESERGSSLFPDDQMFPDWLRARGIGPIAGGPGNYLVVNPSTPVLDIATLTTHPGESALGMLNPAVKVPIEVSQGQTLGHNIPIESYPNYWSKQIPAVSHLGRASGQWAVSDSTQAEGFPNTNNILNILLGAKAYDTGKYQKSAQFDLRDYFRQKAQGQ